MKKNFRRVALMLVLTTVLVITAGCSREADRVSRNLSKQADAFNVTRRVTVFNTRTDTPWLEVIGRISIQYSGGDIDIIMEIADGEYRKHFVGLNGNMSYVVEDISGAYVDKYHYEINYQPEAILPIVIKQYD